MMEEIRENIKEGRFESYKREMLERVTRKL